MSLRLFVAVLTLIAPAALFGWQYRRDQLVKACIEGGGAWVGQGSVCRPAVRPILKRDLERG